MGVVRTIVIAVGVIAIVALLLVATGEKGRLRQSSWVPVVTAGGPAATASAGVPGSFT